MVGSHSKIYPTVVGRVRCAYLCWCKKSFIIKVSLSVYVLRSQLSPSSRVAFSVGEGEKGACAVDVHLVGAAVAAAVDGQPVQKPSAAGKVQQRERVRCTLLG